GKAEAMLERKWPERHNAWGHVSWGGRIYGRGLSLTLRWGEQPIAYGIWGTAQYQSLHERPPGVLAALLQMPEWYLILGALAVLTATGAFWTPLLVGLPLVVVGAIASCAQAIASARQARLPSVRRRLLTAFLHL